MDILKGRLNTMYVLLSHAGIEVMYHKSNFRYILRVCGRGIATNSSDVRDIVIHKVNMKC